MRLSTIAAVMAGLVLGWVVADAGPPPILKDLGEVNPTPLPTAKAYQKKRLITSLTVQNSPEGQTVVTFEASDVGQTKDGKFKPLTAERYSLGDVKPQHAAQRDEILRELRILEEAILLYVDAVGGPRERGGEKGEKRPD